MVIIHLQQRRLIRYDVYYNFTKTKHFIFSFSPQPVAYESFIGKEGGGGGGGGAVLFKNTFYTMETALARVLDGKPHPTSNVSNSGLLLAALTVFHHC